MSSKVTIKLLLATISVWFSLAACGGGDSRNDQQVNEDEVGQRIALLDSFHINRGGAYLQYNSVPPTSGPHWGATHDNPRDTGWARCGIYDEELPDEQILHNLEHGQAIISHNLTDQAEIDRLEDIARDLPDRRNWLIVRPYSKINEGEVAVTSWGWLDRFQGVDEDRIRAFYDAHVNKAPESVSCLR